MNVSEELPISTRHRRSTLTSTDPSDAVGSWCVSCLQFQLGAVLCVDSKFAEVICMEDLKTRKEEKNHKGTGLYLPVDFSPDDGKTFTSFDMKHESGADFVARPSPSCPSSR